MRNFLIILLIISFFVGVIFLMKNPNVVSIIASGKRVTQQTHRVETTEHKSNHLSSIHTNDQESNINSRQFHKVPSSLHEQRIQVHESTTNRVPVPAQPVEEETAQQAGSRGQSGWGIDWEKETQAGKQLGESANRIKTQWDYVLSIIEAWKSKDQMALKRLIDEQPTRAKQCEEDAAQIAEALADSMLTADLNGFAAEFWIRVSAAIASAQGKSLTDTRLMSVWGKLCNSGVAAASSKNPPMAFHKLRQALILSQTFTLTDSSGTRNDSLLGLSLERLSYAYYVLGDNPQAESLKEEAERILGRQCVWPPESIALISQ